MDIPGPSKRLKLEPKLSVNWDHDKDRIKRELRQVWEREAEISYRYNGIKQKVIFSANPFLHVEIFGFIAETEYLQGLVKKILHEVKPEEKSSDLFKFKQSSDLVSVAVPEVQVLREFFETTVLEFLKDVTGIPLDGNVDMFFSEYNQTDFLLCHDDELESRRIAFILYLSEDWNPVNGGSLDLFASSDKTEPLDIVKSINPAFNKLVFFNVTSKSFHQVAEVIGQNARRLAVSGWFYGEPLPRPVLNFPDPESHSILETLSSSQNFDTFITEEYLSPSNFSAINASLEEYSIAKLKLLIRTEKYDPILSILEGNQIQWKQQGPANLRSFQSPKERLLPILDSSYPLEFQNFIQVFFSKKFYQFLEKVTEFELLQDSCRVTCSLRRFQHKDYILLKDKHTDNRNAQPTNHDEEEDDDDEGEEWEIAEEDEEENDEIESTPNLEPAAEKSLPAIPVSSETQSSPNIEPTAEKSAPAIPVSSETSNQNAESPVPANPVSSDTEQENELLSEDEEGDHDEREIDVIYYFGDFSWGDTFGGQTVYADSTGQQLLTVTPEPNTLAIVVREKGVTPYVSYINCLAGDQQFHALMLTISGFKETD